MNEDQPQPAFDQSTPESLYHQPGPTSFSEPIPPPVAPERVEPLREPQSQPLAVVKTLSVRGVEYGMMTVALLISAATLAWAVLSLINGGSGFDDVVVPVSALIVCAPIFGLFFLRLKRAELTNPVLRQDPSRRRWLQLIQFVMFFACLVNVIVFVYSILENLSGKSGYSLGKSIINLAVILVIAGGTLAYYWVDEHRSLKA